VLVRALQSHLHPSSQMPSPQSAMEVSSSVPVALVIKRAGYTHVRVVIVILYLTPRTAVPASTCVPADWCVVAIA